VAARDRGQKLSGVPPTGVPALVVGKGPDVEVVTGTEPDVVVIIVTCVVVVTFGVVEVVRPAVDVTVAT
jgi:hypothetical protein